MKKFMLVALVMLFFIPNLMAQNFWFVSGSEGGRAAANNIVTLKAGQDNFIYCYFRGDMNPVDGEFDKVVINFKTSAPVEVRWQCVYYASMSGGVLGDVDNEKSTGNLIQSGPMETDFSKCTMVWSGRDKTLNKALMNGFCLKVPVAKGAAGITFTMENVEFIGLKKNPPKQQ